MYEGSLHNGHFFLVHVGRRVVTVLISVYGTWLLFCCCYYYYDYCGYYYCYGERSYLNGKKIDFRGR